MPWNRRPASARGASSADSCPARPQQAGAALADRAPGAGFGRRRNGRLFPGGRALGDGLESLVSLGRVEAELLDALEAPVGLSADLAHTWGLLIS
jgi:hypothetical protein